MLPVQAGAARSRHQGCSSECPLALWLQSYRGWCGHLDTFKPTVHRILSSGYIVTSEHQAIVRYSNISASPEYEGYISDIYVSTESHSCVLCTVYCTRAAVGRDRNNKHSSAQAEMQTEPWPHHHHRHHSIAAQASKPKIASAIDVCKLRVYNFSERSDINLIDDTLSS